MRVFLADGDGVDFYGVIVPRENLETAAEARYVDIVGSLTADGCDVVVAPESGTMSPQTAIAHQLQIPVVSVADFLTGVDDRVPVEGLIFA